MVLLGLPLLLLIDSSESERLARMKKIFPDADDGDLMRFLRARQLVTKSAAEMYQKCEDVP